MYSHQKSLHLIHCVETTIPSFLTKFFYLFYLDGVSTERDFKFNMYYEAKHSTAGVRNSTLLGGFNTGWPKDRNYEISLIKIGFSIDVTKN